MNAATAPRDDPHYVSLLVDIHERLAIIETQNTAILGEQDEAKVSRRLLHEKQDAMNSGLAVVKAEIERMAPQVRDHEQLRQQFRGATYILMGLGAVALTSAGFVLKQVWDWLAAHMRWG